MRPASEVAPGCMLRTASDFATPALTEEGWRKLTLRWGLFFFVLAALNEIVWRNFSTDTWVSFKVWGIMPLTMIFAMAQTPLIMKHEVKDNEISG